MLPFAERKLIVQTLLNLGVLLLVGTSTLKTISGAEPNNKRHVEAQVRGLILELDSNQRMQRQQAEKDLLDLGPAILDVLPPLELLPSQGVRAAVTRIRIILERRKAQESVQGSLVKFSEKDLTLAEWLKQLEAQTTNHVDQTAIPVDLLQSRVESTGVPVPFWKLLDDVLQQKHLRYQFAADSPTVKLVPETDSHGDQPWATSVEGPFRIAIESVKQRKVTGDDRLQRLRTDLAITPEPRLRALFLKLAAKDFQAIGPTGQRFMAADEGAQYDLPLGEGGRHVRWNLDFSAPATLTGKDLFPLKITGKASMQIAAGSEHIRFTDLVGGAGTARRRGGVTVTMQKVIARKNNDGTQSLSVKVLVVYDTGGPAFESHRTWIFHNEVYLDRHEADPLPLNAGFDTDLHANGAVGVTYRFEGLKEPLENYNFVYVAPTLIVDVPVKIEVSGVLPK